MLEEMSLDKLAMQVLMPAVWGDRLEELPNYEVGGVVVMSWTAQNTAKDLQAMKFRASIPLLIATDEEGGDVQRFKIIGELQSQQEVASELMPIEAYRMILEHGKSLKKCGIDIVFGPCVDLAPELGNSIMGSRVFSSRVDVVTEFAECYIAAWREAGIFPVIKHFPGHGSAGADSHIGPALTPSFEFIRRRDIEVFKRLAAKQPDVMVGHLLVPGLSTIISSLSSKVVTGFLRRELGYKDALVYSDALDMQAIARVHTLPDAVVLALKAGIDVVVFTKSAETAQIARRIKDAVLSGELAESRLKDAVGRILRRKKSAKLLT